MPGSRFGQPRGWRFALQFEISFGQETEHGNGMEWEQTEQTPCSLEDSVDRSTNSHLSVSPWLLTLHGVGQKSSRIGGK